MKLDPQLEMNYKDRRIILPKEGGEVLDPVRVLRADIDYNRHMNNANYVRVAMELLPEGVRSKACGWNIVWQPSLATYLSLCYTISTEASSLRCLSATRRAQS